MLPPQHIRVKQQKKEKANKAAKRKSSMGGSDERRSRQASFGPASVVTEAKEESETQSDGGPRTVSAVMALAQQSGSQLLAYSESLKAGLVDTELTPAKDEFASKAAAITKTGALLIAALHKAEASVLQTYGAFLDVANEYERYGSQGVPGMPEGFGAARDLAAETGNDPVIEMQDLWLEEFRYRTAVGLLQMCWQQATGSLGALFTEAKAAEALRRTRIQESLRRYAGSIGNQYAGLSAPITALIGAVERQQTDPQGVDAEILAKMQVLVAEDPQRAAAESKSTNAEVNELLGSLNSPLSSPMVKKVAVLQLKEGGILGKWTPVLAVATVDGMLHLWKIPSDICKKAATKNWPTVEEALPSVLPKPNLDVADDAKAKKLDSASAKVDEDVVDEHDVDEEVMPSASNIVADRTLCITNTVTDFKPSSARNDTTFELTELVSTHGVESFMRGSKNKKVVLRGPTQNDMVDWVVLIRNASFRHILSNEARERESESKA